ncbi:MAG TPA: hypothetical protein V6C97_32360 [Oculatellaceae cyanobacterium]
MKGFSSLFPIKFKKEADASQAGPPSCGAASSEPPSGCVSSPEVELIASSGLFDFAWYSSQLSDSLAALPQEGLIVHFLAEGAAKGLNPHRWFDSAYYVKQNPDVAAACINPLVHFLRSGWREVRRPHPSFDPEWYRMQYRDLCGERSELEHYVNFGQNQLCFPSKESFRAALDTEPDLKAERERLELSPVRVFEVPPGPARVNLLLDSLFDTPASLAGVVLYTDFLAAVFVRYAHESNLPLRVVTRKSRVDESKWLPVVRAFDVGLSVAVEFCFCDFIDGGSELPVYRDELFFVEGPNNVRALCTSLGAARVVELSAGFASESKSKEECESSPHKANGDSVHRITISGALSLARIPEIVSSLRSAIKRVSV